jgi:uncharacterized protein (TIGR03084 family)
VPADMAALISDLTAETAEPRDLVSGLDAAGWLTPTPAPGWMIADQISHLAFFDDAAVTAATDPDRFSTELSRAEGTSEITPDDIAIRYRGLSGSELLDWFDLSRRRLIEIFAGLDPAARLPWFGPPMSAASAVTARIMETWAHGQDIADALGAARIPSDRLRHVAHLGVRALPFSFLVNGLEVPGEPVRIELTLPSGEPLMLGSSPRSSTPSNLVTGPALDFCLLVTHRRHRQDTALVALGPVADRWLDIAQAFAGPPGKGRRPGQFADQNIG